MCGKSGKGRELKTVDEIVLLRQITEEGGYKTRGKLKESLERLSSKNNAFIRKMIRVNDLAEQLL